MDGRRRDVNNGKSWLYKPQSVWTWSFFAVVITQLIICLSIEGTVFADFQNNLMGDGGNKNAIGNGSLQKAIPTYLTLLIIGFLYEVVLTYDAMRSQNTIQAIGLVLMNTGILIYTCIQPEQIHDAFNSLLGPHFIQPTYWAGALPLLIALPCVVALFTVAMAVCTWGVYKEFGWKIYKEIVGADIGLKNRFQIYQIYIALLKFDAFLFIGFAVQFLVIVDNTTPAEKVVTGIALPLFIVMLLLAAYSTQRENKWGTMAAMFCYVLASAYFIFKLVRMYTADSQRILNYIPARKPLTTFAVLTLLLMIVTIVFAILCWRNYNTGLKPHILRAGSRRRASVSSMFGSDVGKHDVEMDGGRADDRLMGPPRRILIA